MNAVCKQTRTRITQYCSDSLKKNPIVLCVDLLLRIERRNHVIFRGMIFAATNFEEKRGCRRYSLLKIGCDLILANYLSLEKFHINPKSITRFIRKLLFISQCNSSLPLSGEPWVTLKS